MASAVRDRGEPPGVFRGFGEKTRLLLLLEQPAPDPGLGDGVGVLRGGRVVPVVHGIRGGGRVVPVVVVVDVHDTARELAPLLPPLRLVLRDGFAVGPVLVRPPAPLGGLDAARLLLAVLLLQPLAERDGRELTGGRGRGGRGRGPGGLGPPGLLREHEREPEHGCRVHQREAEPEERAAPAPAPAAAARPPARIFNRSSSGSTLTPVCSA